jgi:tryptophan-rich sensory protein
MSNFSLANSLPVSERIYRALLTAYPKKFREHYETQMVQVFRDSFREAHHRNGMAGVIDLWLHTFADLLVTALVERIAERSQYMFSPKVIVWGSIASVFGGLLWLFVALAWQSEVILPLALLLTLGGLLAIHTRLGKQAGTLGWTGFVLGILGTGMVLYLLVKDWISRNSFSFESSILDALLFVLGIGFLGTGCSLIGLRTRRTEILPSGRSVPLVLGVLYIGFGTSLGLLYYLATVRGIDPWNPTTIPAVAVMLLPFPIGILWMVLGAILAGEAAGLETSNHPSASA